MKSDWPASRIPTDVNITPSDAMTFFTISRGVIPGFIITSSAIRTVLPYIQLCGPSADISATYFAIFKTSSSAPFSWNIETSSSICSSMKRVENSPFLNNGCLIMLRRSGASDLTPSTLQVAGECPVHYPDGVGPVRPGRHQEHEQRVVIGRYINALVHPGVYPDARTLRHLKARDRTEGRAEALRVLRVQPHLKRPAVRFYVRLLKRQLLCRLRCPSLCRRCRGRL